MSHPLQQTGYRASEYERPNDSFHCGRLSEGRPCAFGPSSKGSCGWVCTPRVRENGSGECGRPASHQCAGGPSRDAKGNYSCSQVACQPRPTLRRVRGLLSVAAIVVTIGFLALLVANPKSRDQLVSPGPLSGHHSALACADCHAAASADESETWTSEALKREHLSAQIDSEKCSECHKLEKESWRHAHSLPVDQVEALQGEARARWDGKADRPQPGLLLAGSRTLARQYGSHDADGYKASKRLECSNCHREHGGRDETLLVVPEHRCHICHTVAFESFEDGHPEFNAFGKRALPGNSIFTHFRHYDLRFKTEKQKLACDECHVADSQGRHMVLKPKVFDQVCTRCHQHRENLTPLELIQLPPGSVLKWVDDVRNRIDDKDVVRQGDFEGPKVTKLLELLLPEVDHAKGIKAWKQLRKRYKSLIIQAPEDTDEDGKFSTGDWGDGRRKIRKKDIKKLLKARKKFEKPARAWLEAVGQLLETLAKGDVSPIRRAFGFGPEVDLSRLQRALPVKAFKAFRDGMLGASEGDAFRQPPNLGGDWMGFGQWRWRSSSRGQSLTYEEYSHVEPFLKALVDLLPHLKKENPARGKLWELVQERCGKCHVNPELPPARQVQWTAIPAPKTMRRLTHFAHVPHLDVSPDCRGCHAFPQEEPDRAASDFVIVEDWRTRGKVGEAGCLKCHNTEQYGASCQMCHDYHAGSRAPASGTLPLHLKEPK